MTFDVVILILLSMGVVPSIYSIISLIKVRPVEPEEPESNLEPLLGVVYPNQTHNDKEEK